MASQREPVGSNDYEMNAHLGERIPRGRKVRTTHIGGTSDDVVKKRSILNTSIRRYVKKDQVLPTDASWQNLPELPTSDEIFELFQTGPSELALDNNIIVGPHMSKEDYLNRHYSLLREDAVGPLRDAVSEVQHSPFMLEKSSRNNAYIYEKVYVTGITFANSGIAVRFAFSLGRVQKGVNWTQSKRLRTGNLVALTPASSIFKAIAHVGIVAARPPSLLQEDPPKIDIFFADIKSIQLDPQQEWLMVESRNGFYEGHRHVMKGLQALSQESFPLNEHIVDLQRNVPSPDYVLTKPVIETISAFPSAKGNTRIDITKGIPKEMPTSLDGSQLEALERALSKKLALIQGPPGTGKTHVSVVALKILIQNMAVNDPPIIVASHTNHAVDQLLRHISSFEQDFVRLGAMSMDANIKTKTVFEMKRSNPLSDPYGCLRTPAVKEIRQFTKELKSLLEPIAQSQSQPTKLLSIESLEGYRILTPEQCSSLVDGAKAWYNQADCDIDAWLGDEKTLVRLRNEPDGFPLDPDDIDLELEEVKEMEAETMDSEEKDTLHGEYIDLKETWTGRKMIGISDAKIQHELKVKDLYDIPPRMRGPVYRFLQSKLKRAIENAFREKAARYMVSVRDARIGRWEVDFNTIRGSKILGMTSSGLAKNRALIQALKPRIVLIEEAAETLEPYVSVACFESLEHLILVGDHQQLRGHCHVEELAMGPFWLGISIFERLLRNSMEYTQLAWQRRMTPEIRRLIAPSYPKLKDHSSTISHGVAGVDVATFFLSHAAVESSDSNMSKCNDFEADLIVAFVGYLIQNELEQANIAILAFYNGQRKLLRKKLHVASLQVKVHTIDSYQGEECEVVILSCVRSNSKNNIGFLEIENRVIVSLSRAKQGLYIFGNAANLCLYLPLRCSNHGNVTFVQEADDFASLNGGCRLPCNQKLECGHMCPLSCHPFPHGEVQCSNGCGQSHCKELNWTARKQSCIDETATSRSQWQIADLRREQLDKENAARLFGEVDQTSQAIDNMTLTGIRNHDGGRRGVWTGLYNSAGAQPLSKAEASKAEESLLD